MREREGGFRMTSTLDRIDEEVRFHDSQAADRAATYQSGRAELRFQDDDYLSHESWIRPAFLKLGELSGRCVLDYGCGHGMAAVVMARAGARVHAFDLSPGYVEEARARAEANQVGIQVRVANGEELPYPDGTFDAVWGCAILHHLDLKKAARELRRVLRPGGVAVFCEPWGGNPLLSFARNYLPYPGKGRTRDERPLDIRDLHPIRESFPDLEWEGHQLFGMIHRVVPAFRLSLLNSLDRAIIRGFPALKKWSRYVVLTMRND